MVQILALLSVVALLPAVLGHPGHSVREEAAERAEFLSKNKRDLSHCADKLETRGHVARSVERRTAAIAEARAKRNLKKKRNLNVRDAASVVATSHLSSLNVTADTTSSGKFGVEDIIYSNSSCILQPEGEVGPYYVSGEYVRKDLREDQAGVDVIIDGQFIDVNTCEPVANVYWDIWNCNATGVYAGVIATGNGDENDATNINNTFLRGLQPSDGDGVAQFHTIFPGHYDGRTTHMHVVSHMGGEILANGTYVGGTVPHIGQVFWEQDLINAVEATAPYNTNTIAITENIDDRVFATESANESDPVFNYVLLGDTVEDGIFGWVVMGIDTTGNYTWSAASKYTADGGVALDSTSSETPDGTGNGTAAGNGTMGAPPS